MFFVENKCSFGFLTINFFQNNPNNWHAFSRIRAGKTTRPRSIFSYSNLRPFKFQAHAHSPSFQNQKIISITCSAPGATGTSSSAPNHKIILPTWGSCVVRKFAGTRGAREEIDGRLFCVRRPRGAGCRPRKSRDWTDWSKSASLWDSGACRLALWASMSPLMCFGTPATAERGAAAFYSKSDRRQIVKELGYTGRHIFVTVQPMIFTMLIPF